MRMPTALLALVALATPATASSGDAWETFRQDVATACTALLQEEGDFALLSAYLYEDQ